jgi:sugar lactone lactonase YvrE
MTEGAGTGRTAEISTTVVAHGSCDTLGEGPVWDDRRAALLRVDVLERAVRVWDPADDTEQSRCFQGDVGAVLLTTGDELVVAVERELRLVGTDGASSRLVTLDASEDLRFNDCQCDPAGRIWAGTISRSRNVGSAGLFRLEDDLSLTAVLTGATISNGLCWGPNADLMYHIDSWQRRIDVYEYDAATGDLGRRRTLAEVPEADGLPDGMTIDSAGVVWVALFGGGVVRGYAMDGSVHGEVRVPTRNVSSAAFGAEDHRTLYITSGRVHLSDDELRADPSAGAVWAARRSVPGLAAYRYQAPASIAG